MSRGGGSGNTRGGTPTNLRMVVTNLGTVATVRRTMTTVRRTMPLPAGGTGQAKSELTESELWIRLIASPSRRAIETCRIFPVAFASGDSGIVSETTSS